MVAVDGVRCEDAVGFVADEVEADDIGGGVVGGDVKAVAHARRALGRAHADGEHARGVLRARVEFAAARAVQADGGGGFREGDVVGAKVYHQIVHGEVHLWRDGDE